LEKTLKVESRHKTLDGFIVFLAVQELIAGPILSHHFSFEAYFRAFILSTILMYIYCILNLRKKLSFRKTTKVFIDSRFYSSSIRRIFSRWNPWWLMAIMLIIVQIVLSTVMGRFNGDDSFYLSLVEQNIGAKSLYSYDPSTGNPDFPMMPFYLLEGWEIILSSISHLTNIPVVILVYTVIPILIIVLSYVAYSRLFGEIVDKKYIPLMIVFLSVFHLVGGYSPRSHGTFLLGSSWYGKTIFLHIIIPLLQEQLLIFLKNPQKYPIIFIMIINIAAICLSSSAIYLCGFMIMSFLLLGIIIRQISWKSAVMMLCPLIPLAISSWMIYERSISFVYNWQILSNQRFSFIDEATNYLRQGIYFACFVVLFPLYGVFRDGSVKRLLFWYPLILLAILINPVTAPFVAKKMTSFPTYWRVFWLLPLGTTVSYTGVLLFRLVNRNLLKTSGGIVPIGRVVTVLFYALVIASCGDPVYSKKNGFTMYASSYKIPPDIVDMGLYLKNRGRGKLIAPQLAVTYIRGLATNVELLFSRDLYMRGFLDPDAAEYKERMALYQLTSSNNVNYIHLSSLLLKYKVKWILCEKKNETLLSYLYSIGAASNHSNDQYILMELSNSPRS